MSSFEERLTAWIDGRLSPGELAEFEKELMERPDAALLRDEREDAGKLRTLLRENPATMPLPNADFFNRQILQRIGVEAMDPSPEPVKARRGLAAFFGSLSGGDFLSPARLLAAGALCLLLAIAGYFTLIPRGSGTVKRIAAGPEPAAAASAERAGNPASSLGVGASSTSPGIAPRASASSPTQLAKRDDHSEVLSVRAGSPGTSATVVHLDNDTADVVWLDGLDYLPQLSDGDIPGTANPVGHP